MQCQHVWLPKAAEQPAERERPEKGRAAEQIDLHYFVISTLTPSGVKDIGHPSYAASTARRRDYAPAKCAEPFGQVFANAPIATGSRKEVAGDQDAQRCVGRGFYGTVCRSRWRRCREPQTVP